MQIRYIIPRTMSAEHSLKHYRILDDHKYQDWLAAVNLTKTSAGSSNQPFDASWMPGFVPETMEMLEQNRGYLVAHDVLPGGEHNRARADQLRNAALYNREFPDILNVKNMGLAFGVDEFNLTPTKLTMLHFGWKRLGRLVPVSRHADYLYGSHDEADIRATQAVFTHLHQETLQDTPVIADHISLEGEKYIRITTETAVKKAKSGKRLKRKGQIPFYLQKKFQDWLVTEAGLAKRTVEEDQDYDWKTVLAKNKYVCGSERLAVNYLAENAGYIVDRMTLTKASLGEPLPANWIRWRDRIASNVSDKINPEIGIATFDKLGVGIGIKDLALRPLTLRLLALMWENISAPINIEKLSLELYGNTEEKTIKMAQYAVQDLAGALRETPVAAGWAYTYGDDKRSSHPILVKRSSILAA